MLPDKYSTKIGSTSLSIANVLYVKPDGSVRQSVVYALRTSNLKTISTQFHTPLVLIENTYFKLLYIHNYEMGFHRNIVLAKELQKQMFPLQIVFLSGAGCLFNTVDHRNTFSNLKTVQ